MSFAFADPAKKNDYCHRKIESVWSASKSVLVGTNPARMKFESEISIEKNTRSRKKIAKIHDRAFQQVHGFKKSGNYFRP